MTTDINQQQEPRPTLSGHQTLGFWIGLVLMAYSIGCSIKSLWVMLWGPPKQKR